MSKYRWYDNPEYTPLKWSKRDTIAIVVLIAIIVGAGWFQHLYVTGKLENVKDIVGYIQAVML